MSKTIIVHFHRTIQDATNGIEQHTFVVNDFGSLICGIRSIFPKMNVHFNDVNHLANMFCFVYDNKTKVVPNTWYLKKDIPEDIEELWMVPIFQGAGGKSGQLAIGLALIVIASLLTYGAAAGWFGASGSLGAGLAGFAGSIALGVGVNLVLSSLFVQELKSPIQDIKDSKARRNNDAFEGLVNTTDQSVALALHYGNVRVAGQFISGSINTVSHGADDIITVGSYFD